MWGFVRVPCRQIVIPWKRERLTLWWELVGFKQKDQARGVVLCSHPVPQQVTWLVGSSCGSLRPSSAEPVGTAQYRAGHLPKIRGSKRYDSSFLSKPEPEGTTVACSVGFSTWPPSSSWVSPLLLFTSTLGLSYHQGEGGHVEEGETQHFSIFLFLFFLSKNL